MATVAALSTLKLVAEKRPTEKPVIVTKREKLFNRICEQIDVATARANGTTHVKTNSRRVRDKLTGEIKDVQMLQYPKPWWWTAENGKIYLSVKYGPRVIELQKGKTAIEVGTTADLVPTLEKLKLAVQGNELDAVLDAIALPFRKIKAVNVVPKVK